MSKSSKISTVTTPSHERCELCGEWVERYGCADEACWGVVNTEFGIYGVSQVSVEEEISLRKSANERFGDLMSSREILEMSREVALSMERDDEFIAQHPEAGSPKPR